jgi:hypothetical protein
VSLRWVAERLKMGHDGSAGRGPRKMKAETLRKFKRARAKLQKLEGGTVCANRVNINFLGLTPS